MNELEKMEGEFKITIIEKDQIDNLDIKSKWKTLSRYLKLHGNKCISYSSLQKDLNYFIIEEVGYLSYYNFHHKFLSRKGKKIVIGDPITDEQNFEYITKEFLKRNKHVMFIQISEDYAKILHKLGFKINQFGVETELDLNEFSIIGTKGKSMRHTINIAKREGVEVFEKDIDMIDKENIERISNDWLKRKGGHELVLLTRPLITNNEPDVRYFWSKQNGTISGMIIFDPIYKNEKIIGYYHNFVRILSEAETETSDFITIKAIEKFKNEGVNRLSFGLSPLSNLEKSKNFNDNKLSLILAKSLYKYGNFIYPFKGNENFKKKYHGQKNKVYLASTSGNKPHDILVTMKSLGVF